MNDDRDHRLPGEPRSDQAGERTGFWSPQWDEDDDDAAEAGKPSPSRPGPSAPPVQPQGTPPGLDQRTRPRRPAAGPGRATPPGGPRRPNHLGQPGGPAQPTMRVPLPPPPRNPGDAPTVVLPPVAETVQREPELITHREPLPDELAAGAPDDLPAGAATLSESQRKKARRKNAWRRVRRTCYVLTGLGILGPIVAFFVAYQYAKVPSTADILGQANQVGLITYSNGAEMTKILPKDAHALVTYDQLPDYARQAVFAAEDRSFMQNKGFDFQAIARAVWVNLRGGGGGASTISQQYVKNATKQDQRTLSRKFMELATSAKMNKSQSKEDIIMAYLNIIYFGRGATGIEEASQAYFNHPAKDLTLAESALLAGVIQSPNRLDPAVNQAAATTRWDYVLKGMVINGAIDKATRDAQKFPAVRPSAEGTAAIRTSLIGPRVYIENQVMKELESQGFSRKRINQEGLKVTTTIDPKAQQAAETAYQEVMVNTKQPDGLLAALVAVDPKTGGVIAYHGSGNGTGLDWANQLQQPGSSFKPFVFAASLKQGGGLLDTYDGSSPRTFPERPDPVRNSGNAQCKPDPKQCTAKDAMTQSVNTVFYDMGLRVKTAKVAEAAFQAGIPKEVATVDGPEPLLVRYDDKHRPMPGTAPDGNVSIGGGNTHVRPLDMAYAYSTFAANGMKAGTAPHFVTKIVDSQGKNVWENPDRPAAAFDQADLTKNADIARNVTESMIDVPKTSNLLLSDNRPVAGKTGTQQSETDKTDNANSAAWMVGYTPQVAAAVWVGANKDNGAIKGNYTGCNSPSTPCRPGHDIYGRQEPGVIWQKFMDAYLNGKTQEQFPKLNPLGKPPPPPSTSETPTSTLERTTDQAPQTSTNEATTTTTTSKLTKTRSVPTIPTCSLLAACPTTTDTTTPTHGGGGGG